MNMNTIPINGDKLRAEIYKRNYSLSSAGAEIGFSENFFVKNCKLNRLSQSHIIVIEKVLGIPFEAYKATPEPELPNVKTVPAPLDYERLYKVIYSAVYEAVKKAWSE